MYVRPRGRTSRRRGFSIRRLLVWTLVPVLIVAGAGVFHLRDQIRQIVAPMVDNLAQNAVNTVATIAAPTPLPTADPSSNRRLAEAAWQNGQFQESVRLYEQILPALPNDATAHYYYTLGLIMQGRISDAVVAAENAVTANPFSSDTWAIRAMALNRAQRYTESMVSAMRAVELNPESARAHAYLAETYADLGSASRAELEIEAALDANPDSFEARYVNGMYQWELVYDYGVAREELQNAYDLSNGAAHIGLRLAQLLMGAPVFSEADKAAGVDLLNDILDRNPDSAPILYALGYYSSRTLGDNERGETYLRRCVTAVPTNIDCNYELGRVLERLGQTDEARQAFARLIDDLGSTDPYHYYWAGFMAFTGLGDCGAAMRYFQPGYQLVENGINGSVPLAYTTDALRALQSNYQDVMTPCVGVGAFPTPLPEATPDVDA